jgi:hypothetical protein
MSQEPNVLPAADRPIEPDKMLRAEQKRERFDAMVQRLHVSEAALFDVQYAFVQQLERSVKAAATRKPSLKRAHRLPTVPCAVFVRCRVNKMRKKLAKEPKDAVDAQIASLRVKMRAKWKEMPEKDREKYKRMAARNKQRNEAAAGEDDAGASPTTGKRKRSTDDDEGDEPDEEPPRKKQLSSTDEE